MIVPAPLQAGQVCWIEKKPCCMRTWPAPPQVAPLHDKYVKAFALGAIETQLAYMGILDQLESAQSLPEVRIRPAGARHSNRRQHQQKRAESHPSPKFLPSHLHVPQDALRISRSQAQ